MGDLTTLSGERSGRPAVLDQECVTPGPRGFSADPGGFDYAL